jgi:hypothetical protein
MAIATLPRDHIPRVALCVQDRCANFLVCAARHDLDGVVSQRPLQRLRLVPRRAHPDVALLVRGGSTAAFGAVSRKP